MKTASKIAKSILRSRAKPNSRFKSIGWVREKILKHQEDQSTKQLAMGKLAVSYQRPWELLHTYREIFEREIYRFETKKDSPLIIDCGANIGLSVLYYKAVYPSASIIAFEPDANNFQLLGQNVAQNNLQKTTVYQQAVWKENGTITFSANATEASRILQDEQEGQTVPAVRLRDTLLNSGDIDFLKIDIEGAEWEVMQDCADALQHVQHLFLEYHGKVQETYKLQGLLKIVDDAGFKVYIKMAADQLQHPFVGKTLPLPYDVQLNLFCYR